MGEQLVTEEEMVEEAPALVGAGSHVPHPLHHIRPEVD
jgi:hypothetical protein